MELSLSRVHFPVTTLGPGRRLGIWFQGCSIRCPGCISADTWGPGRRRIALARLLADIQPWLEQAEGRLMVPTMTTAWLDAASVS